MSNLTEGLNTLDCQNLFGSTKNFDKICLCQIFNLSSMGAPRHRKIFVNSMCQSHETRASIAMFKEFSDLSNIAGTIDWTHIKIKALKKVLSTTLANVNCNSCILRLLCSIPRYESSIFSI